MPTNIAIFWFRRDLRLADNCGLYHALSSGCLVLPIFIFDTHILSQLQDKRDRRVQFIHDQLESMNEQLRQYGSSLLAMHGTPLDCFRKLVTDYPVTAVYCNHDYEPDALTRDREVAEFLKLHQIDFHSFKDQVIFEKQEVVKVDGTPYTVFTPYSKKWRSLFLNDTPHNYPSENLPQNYLPSAPRPLPTLDQLGFLPAPYFVPPPTLNISIAESYDKTRDYPFLAGTTRLSVHLRFGAISIRQLAEQAHTYNNVLLSELIWREFYQMILWHFPHVVRHSFRPEYDAIEWRNDPTDFEKWKSGNTGYPIVDAGMRELEQTGYMHNRVRMITASFLTKHLLIDWRWGEAYFAKKLLDFDLAANNGGWQWSAGTGCDAAPYFRVFNPQLQTEKFDAQGLYIRKWVPEIDSLNYPPPMVDHKWARERCLAAYKSALDAAASRGTPT